MIWIKYRINTPASRGNWEWIYLSWFASADEAKSDLAQDEIKNYLIEKMESEHCIERGDGHIEFEVHNSAPKEVVQKFLQSKNQELQSLTATINFLKK